MSIVKAGRWFLPIIIALSVLLRVGDALYLGDTIEEIRGGTHDQISYDMLAQRVAEGYGFSFDRDWWPNTRAGEPTAHWSYLYTLFLAGAYSIFGRHPLIARLIQAVAVGLAMPYLLYRIARRIFNEPVGLIAAGIAAVYLYFVHYAASLMTEAFYITGILWTVDVAIRLSDRMGDPSREERASLPALLGPGVELGAAMAVTLLLRQVGAFLLAVVCAWLLWAAWRQRRLRRALSVLVVAGAIVVLSIAPWVVRNYLAFDVLTPLPNTNSGFAFFWANHPIYGTDFEAVLSPSHGVSYQDLIPAELRDLNEAALDRALLARGLQFVREDPRRYLLLSLSRIPIYFMFWPTSDSSLLSNVARVLSFGLFLPFMVYGLALSAVRAWREWRHEGLKAVWSMSTSPTFLCGLFILVYTAIHIGSWANVRYRLPVDAFLILFAANGIEHLLTRYQHLWTRLADRALPARFS